MYHSMRAALKTSFSPATLSLAALEQFGDFELRGNSTWREPNGGLSTRVEDQGVSVFILLAILA